MEIGYGKGTTEYGPGVAIELTGDEVATAIAAYLVAHNVHVSGPRTITVNGELCEKGRVYVDPSGFVNTPDGDHIKRQGPDKTVLRRLKVLQAIARAEHFFGSFCAGGDVRKRDIDDLVEQGLAESVGQVPLADADGFTIQPERYKEGFVLTSDGKSFILTHEHKTRLMDL